MYSFAEHEADNTAILIFTKRLDALLSLAGRDADDYRLLWMALEAIEDDEWISLTIRQAVKIALEATPRQGEGSVDTRAALLWVALVDQLAETEIVSDFYLTMLRQVLDGEQNLYFNVSPRKALQMLLAVQGFENGFSDS